MIDSKARVVGLGQDGVRGRRDEVREEDGRVSAVDEETAHGGREREKTKVWDGWGSGGSKVVSLGTSCPSSPQTASLVPIFSARPGRGGLRAKVVQTSDADDMK